MPSFVTVFILIRFESVFVCATFFIIFFIAHSLFSFFPCLNFSTHISSVAVFVGFRSLFNMYSDYIRRTHTHTLVYIYTARAWISWTEIKRTFVCICACACASARALDTCTYIFTQNLWKLHFQTESNYNNSNENKCNERKKSFYTRVPIHLGESEKREMWRWSKNRTPAKSSEIQSSGQSISSLKVNEWAVFVC